MQFIESTIFGVRSAYWKFVSGSDGPIFHLFPMCHIGDQEFYDEVLIRVSKCDIILIEGVKSPTSMILTSSYRYAVRNPKLGLVLQKKIKPEDVTGKIVHADVSARNFEREWASLPISFKLKLYILAPLYGLYLRFFGTREAIARHRNTEFAVSRSDLVQDDEKWEAAKEVLIDWRDINLINKLNEEIEKSTNSQKDIAVVYGAGHMRAITKYLIDTKGYRVESSEWLTIMKF